MTKTKSNEDVFEIWSVTTLYCPSSEHFQGYPVRDRIALGRNIRPRGFRQKIPRSANEQMESRGQVISDLETGYALTTSYLGQFQIFLDIATSKNSNANSYFPMQPAPVTRIYTLQ